VPWCIIEGAEACPGAESGSLWVCEMWVCGRRTSRAEAKGRRGDEGRVGVCEFGRSWKRRLARRFSAPQRENRIFLSGKNE
jgi:hypothetical protein